MSRRRAYTLVLSLLGVAGCTATVAVITVSAFGTSPSQPAGVPSVVAVAPVAPEATEPSALTNAAPRPIALADAEITPPGVADDAHETPLAPAVRTTEAELKRGQTLPLPLGAQGVSAKVVARIVYLMRGHFDFRRAQPGHSYRLVQDPEGAIESFRYRTSQTVSYELSRDADGRYTVDRVEARLWPRQAMIAGIVTSSLYGAITDLGASPLLANDFTDVFAYDIDFSRMVRSGDEFRILYERLYRIDDHGDEIYVRPGRILAARYGGGAGEHTAVYYAEEKERGGYYRPDGSSVERQFLMAPLNYSRISSRFTSARRHPILKITRPHHGIDYAAPLGTPVYAVSAGEVIHKSWAGGFGNLVKIRHDNGYVSYYAHLARFPISLRLGQSVSQKQVIGYVGRTGLATGPHVCFRVAKDGRYVNPATIPSPAGPSLPPELQGRFRDRRDELLAALDSGTLVAADEAL